MFTHPFHVFDNHNASLSEGGALAVVVRDFSETPHGTRDNRDFPRPIRDREARRRLACPPLARRDGAPHERGAGGGSDPPFLTAGAASGRVSRFTSQFTVNPPLGGVAPSTVIPAGRLSSWLVRRHRVQRSWAVEEETDHPREVIEATLAHMVRNRVEAAYARSELFERRRVLMDDWSRYLARG